MLFWIGLFLAVGLGVLFYSRHQPFPEVSSRFAYLLILISAVLWISSTAPRPTSESVPAITAALVGGVAVVVGVRHMTVTHKDVLLAPFGGILMCVGTISLLSERWAESAQWEQMGSFVLASLIVMLEIYLAFRGLVIGVKGLSWSKSGLRQVRRGLIDGPNGAVSHFEKSWDSEDRWLTAMSHAALSMIHKHKGDTEREAYHEAELEKLGGWGSVDESWKATIRESLEQL
ncbi:MAG: hypothetical protein CMB53_03650 [Euryarchaeota archaeon]|nr:hypothetical protein [Euryarchaeota archaeon]|tara:strand:- start:389 stop:1081 length:693 start_codon:yes stop_codon:yes gene_type:complete